MSLRTLGLLIALPAALACGDGSPSAPEAARPAPGAPLPAPAPAPPPAAGAAGAELPRAGCDLLSEAEASEALGLAMRITSPPGSTGCVMESVPAALTLEFMTVTRGAIFDEVAANAAAEPVPSLGEEAVYVQVDGDVMAQLHLANDDRHLVSTLVATSPGLGLRARAEAFGRVVAGRL
jgi:hypothetical protein